MVDTNSFLVLTATSAAGGEASFATKAAALNSTNFDFLSSSSSAADEEVDSCTRIKTIISFLNTTIPLIWLVVGTVTNGLSLIVFSRKTMRRNSTFFYLAIMTLSDFIVIWICSLRDFLAYKFHIYISGSLLCKLHVFVFFLSCQFSSWLLTAANCDRLIYVISYQNAKIWCTKKTAIRVTCTILFLLIGMNFHFLLFVQSENSISSSTLQNSSPPPSSLETTTFAGETDVNHLVFDISTEPSSLKRAAYGNNSSANSSQIAARGQVATELATVNPFVYPLCTLKQGNYEKFYNNYYSWMDGFVFSFIPSIIMSVCNAALIQRVFSTKRNIYRNSRMPKTLSSHNNAAGAIGGGSHLNANDTESQANSRKVSFSPIMDDAHSTQGAVANNNNHHLGHATQRNSSLFKESTPFLTVKERSISTNFLSSGTTGTTVSYLETTNLTSTVSTSGNVLQQQQPSSKPAVSSETTDKMRNLAITIIGVTLLFIIFTLPINIYVPVMASSSDDQAPAPGSEARKKKNCGDLIFCILNNMVNANHSVNFFIYLVTNSKFKKEIELIFDKLRLVLRRYLALMVCCLSCGSIKRDKFNEQARKMNGGKSQRDMIKMKLKDRGISMTSFAGQATFAPSRNNSMSHLAGADDDKSHFLNAKPGNGRSLNFRSQSSTHLCAQSNSSPPLSSAVVKQSQADKEASSQKKALVPAALTGITIPEINYLEPSDDASSNQRSPVSKTGPENNFPSTSKLINDAGGQSQSN